MKKKITNLEDLFQAARGMEDFGDEDLDDEELDDDFESHLEQIKNAVSYLSRHGMDENTIREDIQNLLDEGFELDDVVEKLDDEYPEYDKKVDQDNDFAIPLGKLKSQDARTQIDILNQINPDRFNTPLPGASHHFKGKIIAEGSIIDDLVKIADKLDNNGFHKEAEAIDIIITKIR